MFCYDTNPQVRSKEDFTFNPMNVDTLKCYMNHYKNLLYLDFISRHKNTSFHEKREAALEAIICKRKLKYWETAVYNQGYTQADLSNACINAKKVWA